MVARLPWPLVIHSSSSWGCQDKIHFGPTQSGQSFFRARLFCVRCERPARHMPKHQFFPATWKSLSRTRAEEIPMVSDTRCVSGGPCCCLCVCTSRYRTPAIMHSNFFLVSVLLTSVEVAGSGACAPANTPPLPRSSSRCCLPWGCDIHTSQAPLTYSVPNDGCTIYCTLPFWRDCRGPCQWDLHTLLADALA